MGRVSGGWERAGLRAVAQTPASTPSDTRRFGGPGRWLCNTGVSGLKGSLCREKSRVKNML